ncbi:hypothetical protein JKG47_19640 [Acidithiobacillus sp. MC6.1]|nr:hypothetical protein [Acidithiobacillus sp. MC6.1]
MDKNDKNLLLLTGKGILLANTVAVACLTVVSPMIAAAASVFIPPTRIRFSVSAGYRVPDSVHRATLSAQTAISICIQAIF